MGRYTTERVFHCVMKAKPKGIISNFTLMAFICRSQDASDIPRAKYSIFSSGGAQGQNTHGL